MSIRTPQPSHIDKYFSEPHSSSNVPASGPSSQSSMRKTFRKLRRWGSSGTVKKKEDVKDVKEELRLGSAVQEMGEMDPYEELRPEVYEEQRAEGVRDVPDIRVRGISDISGRSNEEGYEWNMDSDAEDALAIEPDAYSWVDPSIVGTEGLGATPARSRSGVSSPAEGVPLDTANSALALFSSDIPLRFPDPPNRNLAKLPPTPPAAPTSTANRPQLGPADSYNLLLAYQSTSSQSHHSHSTPPSSIEPSSHGSVEGINLKNPSPEWYEMVDEGVRESLPREEVRRQGLWWELIKGEVEYVRDLRTICEGFISPLRNHDPPLLVPEPRLSAFIAEVFSTVPQIYLSHAKLLDKLLARQRSEWPLVTSATDLLLATFLETIDNYEVYMKNFPFAEARVKREKDRNPDFGSFLDDRNNDEMSKRRDVSVFLSRPVTRLPRILLLLDAILQSTPTDHPDKEEIPTVIQVLTGALRGSQPGIESAEAKIKLWNVAEKLLFKKGEVIELDIGEPKRNLVYSGYVFRRIRSETNWHGWQDLHAFLLDNYFILTRDEENGKHVVVSRPIHLDFITVISAGGVPERRYDSISKYQKRPGGHMLEPIFQPERLMFPFTISTSSGPSGRTYTLCASTQAAREHWRDKIEGAKTLRRYDVESNRTFATHNIFIPPDVKDPILTADTFSWLGRETVAIATSRSVYIGWRHDSKSYRELIRFASGYISSMSIVPDFGQLLVVTSGSLMSFDLNEMMPTSEPVTWVAKARRGGTVLNPEEQPVAFVKVGTTKGRLLVVHASHAKNSHQTILTFEEPLHTQPNTSHSSPFRRFATLSIQGYASDLSFFRQTIAVVTEKAFIIAEPGNPTTNSIPTLPAGMSNASTTVGKMIKWAKPRMMFQIGENEFLLCYNWGACFVTKYGEIARDGSFLRWNLNPSYIVLRQPYLLLFDEVGGRAEVREVSSGRVCEVIQEKGMKPVKLARVDQALLALCPKGLLEMVETVEL